MAKPEEDPFHGKLCGVILKEMQGTKDHMRDSIENKDWGSLIQEFEYFNKQVEKVIRVDIDVPKVYIESLVMLEDLLLGEGINNKSKEKKIARKMKKRKITRKATSLDIMKQKLEINNQQYKERITKLRENPESEDDQGQSDEEIKEDSDFDSSCESEDGGDKYDKPLGEGWRNKIDSLKRYFEKNASRITWEKVDRKFKSTRGREGKGILEEIEQLHFLTRVASTPAQKLDICICLISGLFHVNPRGYMPVSIWKKCVHNMFVALDILTAYPNIVLDDSVLTGARETEKGVDHRGVIRIWRGDLAEMYGQISAEFYCSLQSINCPSKEYENFLSCEPMLYVLSQNVRDYLQQRGGDYKEAANVARRQVELVYYKPQDAYVAMRNLVVHTEEGENQVVEEHLGPTPFIVIRRPTSALPENCTTLMDELLTFINTNGDENTKVHAMVFYMYHQAIMGDFTKSREILCSLQYKVQHMDVYAKRDFCRAMAQLGACAFRAGHISEAHSYLCELCAGGNVKELLGQVSESCFPDKSAKQEIMEGCEQKMEEQTKMERKVERMKQLFERRRHKPYHLNMNPELLEAVHLICAMLLEVSCMATNAEDVKDKVICKTFPKQVEVSQGGIYSAETPVSDRDYIMAASMALCKGDFDKFFNFIKSSDFWRHPKDRDNVLEILRSHMPCSSPTWTARGPSTPNNEGYVYSSQEAINMDLVAEGINWLKKEQVAQVESQDHQEALEDSDDSLW